MLTVVVFDFSWPGPFGEEMTRSFRELAPEIAAEPGLRWKLWLENQEEGRAGGVYLFDDEAAAGAYAAKNAKRLERAGIGSVRVGLFTVNRALTDITAGPVQGSSRS